MYSKGNYGRRWQTFSRTVVCKQGVQPDEDNPSLNHCAKTHLDPFLLDIKDPVPYLEIFGQQLRNSRLAPSGQQIRSATFSDYLTLMGQRFTNMGADNPRLNKYGKLDFGLFRQKQSWKKRDKPSVCVKPIPVLISWSSWLLLCMQFCFHRLWKKKLLPTLSLLLSFIVCALVNKPVGRPMIRPLCQKILRFTLGRDVSTTQLVPTWNSKLQPKPYIFLPKQRINMTAMSLLIQQAVICCAAQSKQRSDNL